MSDPAFRAGFIAAEGSFGIRPNNAGRSWVCAFALSLREDDTPLLAELRDETACGRLHPVAAQGNAKPQTAWVIARRDDCVRLASLLEATPLLTKKAGEFDLWVAAVDAWTRPGRSRWPRMAALATEIRRHRRYDYRPEPASVDITPDYLDRFLSGFATGEAHFGSTSSGWPRFTINLRGDDQAVLQLLRKHVGVGSLTRVAARASSKPAISWRVTRLRELERLAALFDRYPIEGRQGRVYCHWRSLLALRCAGHGAQSGDVQRAVVDIRGARAYRPATIGHQASPSDRRRDLSLQALRIWAIAGEGPWTATAYERVRRSRYPEWPKRDTIARQFGSWREALSAAGIPTADARSPRTLARVSAASASGRAARRAAGRAKIIEAVRRCHQTLGRAPSATEFLRWRLDHARETPSQASLFRLFPGGWAEVVAACTD